MACKEMERAGEFRDNCHSHCVKGFVFTLRKKIDSDVNRNFFVVNGQWKIQAYNIDAHLKPLDSYFFSDFLKGQNQ